MVIDEVIGVSSGSTLYTVPQDAVLNIRFYRTTSNMGYNSSTIAIHSVNYGAINDNKTIIEITGQVCKSGTQIQITSYCSAHITGFTVE